MKSKIFNPFVCTIGMMALLLLQGCDIIGDIIKDQPGFGSPAKMVKQVDMAVLVPIHPSSLEYFDYFVTYSDNSGVEYCDTVRKSDNGIRVFCWMRTFSYDTLPVICRCEVTLCPKVSRDSVVSFSYVVPKPCIFSSVQFSSAARSQDKLIDIERLDVLRLDSVRIGAFMSAYGSSFSSTCTVKQDYEGISCNFY